MLRVNVMGGVIAVAVHLAVVNLGGCYGGGEVADAGGDTGATGTDGGDGGSVGDSTAGSASTGADDTGGPALPAVPGPTIRRLTAAEFTHSLSDLIGPTTIAPIEADTRKEGFFSVGNAKIAISPAGVGLYEDALDLATKEAFSDPARVASIMPCVPATVDDTTCYRNAIAGFGRRAWRRALTGAEVERYLGAATSIAAESGDAVGGLRHAVWALLESPNFLYRIEVGEPSPTDGGRLRYTGYEMASRLSYTLWNTTPDEELLTAAESGALVGAAGVQLQAQRMMADPRTRQGVENFVNELYSVWQLDTLGKNAEYFPAWTQSLKAAIREDLRLRIADVVFEAPGDFFSLYDSNKVFINNELARIYGLPEVDPDVTRMVEMPEDWMRHGLIGSAAILAMNSPETRTSATRRGLFIADALLCRVVPPPPPNVDLNLDKDMEGGPKTAREKLQVHRDNPACQPCHDLMDPLGLGLENFDSLGTFRDNDQGLPIDASGELNGVKFANSRELASALRYDPGVPGCLTRKLYTYVTGRLPVYAEREIVELLEDDLTRADNRFDQLLLALVTGDEFRFAQPEGTVIAPDQGDMP